MDKWIFSELDTQLHRQTERIRADRQVNRMYVRQIARYINIYLNI